MKIIDKYIGKTFIKSYSISLIAFVGIFIVSQIFRVLKFVADGNMAYKDIVPYILTLIPKIFVQVSPIAVLLGGLLTVSTMASSLEIISLKTAGVSFRRIVRVPIIIAAFISIGVFVVNDTVYPKAYKTNLKLRNSSRANREIPIEKTDVFLRGESKDNYVYKINKMNRETGFAENIILIDLNEEFNKIDRVILAKTGRYNFTRKEWALQDAYIYHPQKNSTGEEVKIFSENKYSEHPDKFITVMEEPRTLTISGLKKAAREIKSTGGDVQDIMVELGNRYSFPFASFIVVFLGLALGSRYVRGGSALSIGTCICLGYGYYIVQGAFEAWSKSGTLNSFVSGWIPNIIFLLGGLYFLNRAEY